MNCEELFKGPIEMDKEFIKNLTLMLRSREESVDLSFYKITSRASECINFESLNNLENWAYHVALLLKFLYPMMEQLDALIDDKIKIAEINPKET